MAKVGRPTSYKYEYCQKLIDHMAQGFSFEAFAADLVVSKQTLYAWEKEFPEFLDAKEKGTQLCRKFWEKLGIYHILNKTDSEFQGGSRSRSLNAAVWVFNMKNRFGWRDKHPDEVDQININLTLADRVAKARARAKK